MASLARETSKQVTFYEKVTVVHFPSMNRLLKSELFYKRADIEQFEMDAYIEALLRQRSDRRSSEQARCKIMTGDAEGEELQQQINCQDASTLSPVNMAHGLHGRPGTAIAA